MSDEPDGGWAAFYRFLSAPVRVVASVFEEETWLRMLVTGVFVFTLVMIWRVTTGVDFRSLGEPTEARGLITYTIAMGTIALAFCLVIRALYGTKDSEEAFQKRFQHAREVLGVFSGILGTIVGFYFGATRVTPERITIATPQISRASTGTVSVLTYVSGGSAPFAYRITVPGGEKPLAEGVVSREGWLRVELSADALKAAMPGSLEHAALTVTDARDRKSDVTLDLAPVSDGRAGASPGPTSPVAAPRRE
jgi:hypothetical protein